MFQLKTTVKKIKVFFSNFVQLTNLESWIFLALFFPPFLYSIMFCCPYWSVNPPLVLSWQSNLKIKYSSSINKLSVWKFPYSDCFVYVIYRCFSIMVVVVVNVFCFLCSYKTEICQYSLLWWPVVAAYHHLSFLLYLFSLFVLHLIYPPLPFIFILL